MPARLLTLDEAAIALRCSVRTLRRHIRAGAIPVVVMSPKQRRIREQDVDRFVFDHLHVDLPSGRTVSLSRGVLLAPGERLWD